MGVGEVKWAGGGEKLIEPVRCLSGEWGLREAGDGLLGAPGRRILGGIEGRKLKVGWEDVGVDGGWEGVMETQPRERDMRGAELR